MTAGPLIESTVHDHARVLIDALAGQDVTASLSHLDGRTDVLAADLVHLHWVGGLYGWLGLKGIPLMLRLHSRVPVVVTVHEGREAYIVRLRRAPIALCQDVSLQIVTQLATGCIVSTSRYRPLLRGLDATAIPSGSILPIAFQPQLIDRGAPITVGILSSNHPSRMQELAVKTALAIEKRGLGRYRLIGSVGRPEHVGAPRLTAWEMATAIAGCDLILLPYADGVSTRRTSFFSALQAGSAVMTTLKEPVDIPYPHPFAATPAGDAESFIARALELAGDTERIMRLRTTGAAWFAEHFAWPVLARSVRAVYDHALSDTRHGDG